MLSKEELVLKVAESCGVSKENSAYFFEVFVNRLSNKLKAGDLLHFHNYGFFHKRNCRIQLGKSSGSQTGKSYLIQLILYSEEPKIKTDLSSVIFLKIPNLKTLWEDDEDFLKSLNAGDFAPHRERNQLIKSFATTAEVIISGLRKDYDSELVEELIIPLTFDLNFLIKTVNKTIPKVNKEPEAAEKKLTDGNKKTNDLQKTDKDASEALPWAYGTKFLEKDLSPLGSKKVDGETITKKDEQKTIKPDQVKKERENLLSEFELVPSRLSNLAEDTETIPEYETVKFKITPKQTDQTDEFSKQKSFTEVKSKTEAYHLRKELEKDKPGRDSYASFGVKDKFQFNTRQFNFGFIRILSALIIVFVVGFFIYNYFIVDGSYQPDSETLNLNVTLPAGVNVIERDYEFAVTYPYAKTENKFKVSGFNRDIMSKTDAKPIIKPEIKSGQKTETITEVKDKPANETKTETTDIEKPVEMLNKKEGKSSRIFLHKGFYVVYAGSFKSEEAAENEAEKYFNMGYNAFVEVIENGRTKEFKLNVGDFTSEEFARQFQDKYIK